MASATLAVIEKMMGPGWISRVIKMPYHHDSIYDRLLRGERIHRVYYRGGEKPHYVPPYNFYWRESSSPSDCEWIIPGTYRGEFPC